MSVPRLEITEYLRAWEQGDDTARHLRPGRPGHTLQPTALANEAYLRLRDLSDVPWHDRSHFFAIAFRIMRRILDIEETSALLRCSPRTAKRDRAFARAWLLHRLAGASPEEPAET